MHSEAYHKAIEIAIEEAELGLAPEGWPAWTDEIRFAPTEADAREAAEFFNRDPVETFEEWVEGLDDTSFTEAVRAIRTLRSLILRYNAERCEWDEPIAMTDILELF